MKGISKAKKILLIDDHKLFVDGLIMILESSDNNFEVESSNDAQKVLLDIESLASYDLILIDLYMPEFSGFSFLTAMRSQAVNVIVAVISSSEKKFEIERALSLGAQGFIPKESSSEEFIYAAQQLLENKRYLPMNWLGEIDWKSDCDDQSNMPEVLTKRQIEVLELIRDGLQNKQIALVLGISASSVKSHVEQLFKRLSVNNRTSCVQIAQEMNLI